MDLDDFRTVLDTTGVDVWSFIDAAITVAFQDCGEEEVVRRRDSIVAKLYTPQSCGNCGGGDGGDRNNANGHVAKREAAAAERESSPEDADPFGGLFDDEQKRILEIKEQLEDSDQPEDAVIEMLQSLADMDITFKALQETDIGRNVNKLRKHPSNEVRRLVKHLVSKWKETVDEWVNSNQAGELGSSALMGGDSPQQKFTQNGHNQVPDFAYSPNPHNGSSGSDKNNSEPERKPKPVPRKEAPTRPTQPSPASASAAQHRQREQREGTFDSDRLASARRRLQENYKEAENAKKQRTIQVMDIHELPKPKKAFFGRNRGGGSQGGRHW